MYIVIKVERGIISEVKPFVESADAILYVKNHVQSSDFDIRDDEIQAYYIDGYLNNELEGSPVISVEEIEEWFEEVN